MKPKINTFITLEDLRKFQPQHDFFIAVDSDGTVFNSMEVKHKDCFIGNLIRHFGLAAITHQVHEVWNYVNIDSHNRGTNRFKALLLTVSYLKEMEVVKRINLPELNYLSEWVENTPILSNEILVKAVEDAHGQQHKQLQQVLRWSEAVNFTIKKTVYNLPPIPTALKALKSLRAQFDLVVLSNTPLMALQREWNEHNITQYVSAIGGQETGSKTDMLTAVAVDKYSVDHILFIGDAPGDLKAAQNIGALFSPIIPGKEEIAWENFLDEGLNLYCDGSFAGAYQQKCINKFHQALKNIPPWAK